MGNINQVQNEACARTFTKLSMNAKKNMEDFFKNWHSYEEVIGLINEFKGLPADGKGKPERTIVKILSDCNSLTGYKDKHGTKRLCEDRTNADDVDNAAEKYSSFAESLPKEADLDKLFYDKLFEIYKNYKSSGDYIMRLVKDRMEKISPELIAEGDKTRVLIFKQFLKAAEFPKTKCLSRALRDYVYAVTNTTKESTTEEFQSAISKMQDNVFSKLADISNDIREQWEPLIWANDIANGMFNDQRTTRIKLYWFAIIFDMSYYVGTPNEIFDKSTDIQEKLFYEYYADNLINNLLNSNENTEREPTGHGINFKNFVEVIYLYYIHKTGLSPYQKLAEAKKMIDLCKTNDDTLIDIQKQNLNQKNTYVYESFVSQIMNYDKEEFKAFITENYMCGKKGVNPIRIASENTIAADLYKKLLNQMSTTAWIANGYKVSSKTRQEIVLPLLKTASELIGDLPIANQISDEYESFKKILKNIKSKFIFIHKKKNIDDVLKSMFMRDDNIENYVTRTKMIILYYYIFMIQNAIDEYSFNNFGKFYGAFCDGFELLLFDGYNKNDEKLYRQYFGINDILIEAGYQRINSKNIFDSMITFFAFKNYENVKKSYENVKKSREIEGDEED